MKKLVRTLIMGVKKGLDTTYTLGKIIFPVTLTIGLLKYTPIIEGMTTLLAPLMSFFGLTGESAIVFVLGNVLNLYAAIGAIVTMELTVKQVFILAVMLSFSHNIIVETTITTKIGVKPWLIALIRLGMAFVAAMTINTFWSGGDSIAQYGLIPEVSDTPMTLQEITVSAFQTAFLGIFQMAIIVVPIMIGIQILKDFEVLSKLAKFLGPFTRLLGVSEKTGVTLLAGILFGLAYGAGIIIQTAKEENLSKKDIYLVSIFLITCHAVIEDTLIFIPLGIQVLPLLIIRITMGILITFATARIWRKVDSRVSVEQAKQMS